MVRNYYMEVRKPMAKFTLDDIREAAEKKYGSFDIELPDGETVSLLNPMRMDKAKRKELGALQERLNALSESEESVDEESVVEEMLTLVAASPAQAKRLLKALGDDMAMKITVFNQYGESTQAGEA